MRILIDTILFDLDGTLIDTLDDIADAANFALASFGYPTHETARYRDFVGRGVDRLIMSIAPEWAMAPEQFRSLKGCYLERYASHMADKSRPYDGAIDALRELRAMGLALCVISNKPDDDAKAAVSRFFGYDMFDLTAGGSEGTPLKPDPTLALRLVASVESSPERAVLVGDTHIDIETAKNAGMASIGAAWGFRGRAELEAAGATAVIDEWQELADAVRTL